MAPEVILCETIKDTPYDYEADVWSLGELPCLTPFGKVYKVKLMFTDYEYCVVFLFAPCTIDF